MYTVERIDPGKTALFVVDMENDFVAPGAPMETPAGRAMLPQLTQALACCRAHGIPVIYTTHAHRPGGCDLGLLAHDPRIAQGDALVDGSPGVAIFPEIAPRDGEIVIAKHRFSAFYGT
ncbi:MAG: cysteine hydrolase family protein, partial [Thermomicrobiales bacterium]